jgi:hypothetical protein
MRAVAFPRLPLFPFRTDHKLAVTAIPSNQENIRLTADLTVLDVRLAGARGLVDGSFVPLSAARALESREHSEIVRFSAKPLVIAETVDRENGLHLSSPSLVP